MGRYLDYGEQRFRNQFIQKFDFMEFNRELTAAYFGKRILLHIILAILISKGRTGYFKSFLVWF
jgi:hypothetical protein